MINSEEPIKSKSRGIYLLPNLFTTAALFAGFYSIVAAMGGYFDAAAIAIFIAMIADSLDGRIARLTNTQTPFGAQYDSLSDMVAFGLSPALLAFTWTLNQLGKLGWLIAFLYTAATALRLARFNTQAHDDDKRYFQGLPSPAAAGTIASGAWMGFSYGFTVDGLIPIMIAMLTVFVAGLMVSSVRYYSFKEVDFKGKVSFFAVILLVLVISSIAVNPPHMLFLFLLGYVFSGPIITLWQKRKIRREARLARKLKIK